MTAKKDKWFLADKTLYPVYYLMMILGLSHSLVPRFSTAFRLYSWVVFLLLIGTTIRKFEQIGKLPDGSRLTFEKLIVNPRALLTMCNALVMLSGLLASCLLYTLGGCSLTPLVLLSERIDGDRTQKSERRNYYFNLIVVLFCVFLAFAMSITYALSKYGYMVMWATLNLKSETYVCIAVDAYSIFVSRCAISLVALLFCHHCSIIARNIKKLISEMVPQVNDFCPLPETSMKKIHDSQIYYQQIFNAKTVVEDYYSFALFFSYGCCIPIFCLLSYVLLKSHQLCWSETLSISIWMVNGIVILLLFSIPCFIIHEEGDKLVSASFKMYHDTFHEERDLIVLSQMTFFTFQIHSTNLTLSACNYFYMNRRIVLSLFSAIVTYFLILMEFDMKHPSRVNDTIHGV